MGNWEAAAKRTIFGEKTPRTSLAEEGKKSEFWIKPRKYSVEAREEIKLATGDLLERLPDDIVNIIVEKQKKKSNEKQKKQSNEDADDKTDDFLSIFSEMNTLQRCKVMKALRESKGANVIFLVIKNGIGEHNFKDDNESSEVPKEFVDKILNYSPVADEMVRIIQDYNRPLAGGNSGK